MFCKVFKETDLHHNKWIILTAGIVGYAAMRCVDFKFGSAFFGIIMSAGLALAADIYVPSVLKSFRNYTYQIFLISVFVQIAVKMVYRRLDIPYFPIYALCILLGLYVPVAISVAAEKINWTPILLCLGLRKQSFQKK